MTHQTSPSRIYARRRRKYYPQPQEIFFRHGPHQLSQPYNLLKTPESKATHNRDRSKTSVINTFDETSIVPRTVKRILKICSKLCYNYGFAENEISEGNPFHLLHHIPN